jgi:hypothetical protein
MCRKRTINVDPLYLDGERLDQIKIGEGISSLTNIGLLLY